MSGRAFRAQLVTRGERDLFDYWLRSAGTRRMPARSDLDPLKVPQLLPHLGLIDVRNGLDQASFRRVDARFSEVRFSLLQASLRFDQIGFGECNIFGPGSGPQ